MSKSDAVDCILASLHEATFDEACWPATAALIDDACRIKGNMLVYGAGGFHDKAVIFLARFCYHGQRNEEVERRYLEDYYHHDERVPRFRALPDSRLVHGSDLFTEEEKKTSPVFNEFMPLADTRNSLTVRLDGPDASRIIWTFANPIEADGWSFDRTDTIERLLPHLRQYVRVRQAVAKADGLGSSLLALLDNTRVGVIQLEWRGRIVAVNDRARELLVGADGLFDEEGCLCARLSAEHATLQGLLAQALPGLGGLGVSGSMAVTRSPGLSRLVLHVSPVGDRNGDVPSSGVAVLVLVVDPE